jgi:hypothetical protein
MTSDTCISQHVNNTAVCLFIPLLFIKDTCIAHYPRVSSKRFTFTHHWLCYLGNTRVTATQYWCARSVITSVIQSGFILQSFYCSFIFHTFSARSLSSLDLNPPSELPIIKLIKICSILMVEETGVPGGNHRYMIRAENPFYTVQLI